VSFSFLMIFLADFPTDLKHECLMFLMRLHRLSLVGLLLHLCNHLELTIHPWWLPYQCLQVLQSSAATQVRIQKGLSAQGPTGPEMKLAYCWEIWGSLYDSCSAVLARPTLFFLCAENYLVFGEHSRVRRWEKAGFLLSWTKSSIILSWRNIRFCKVISLINLCKLNKQTTVVTTSPHLRRYLPYLFFLSLMMTAFHGKNLSSNICLNA